MALADEVGIEALTIRRLATAPGTKPMTIYATSRQEEETVEGVLERVLVESSGPRPMAIGLAPSDNDACRPEPLPADTLGLRHSWRLEHHPAPRPWATSTELWI